MKRIALWVLSTVSVVALLFGYRTSTSGSLTSAQVPVVGNSQAPAPGAAGGSTSTGTTTGDTVTGSVVQTRWGPVQVEITTSKGSISKVAVVQYPSGNREDEQINGYALPILVDETLQAQSASIDMVSGATVTSEGYVRSLQSALDQASL